MASNTTFLGLTLPGFGEYNNSWWEPINENFESVDAKLEDHDNEILSARQTKTSLLEFLQVSHNADGTLKPTAEVEAARASSTYGHRDSVTTDLLTLGQRITLGEKELWSSRISFDSLISAMAYRHFMHPNVIIEGAKDANGYPTWMGSADNKVIVDGSTTPLSFLIAGHIGKIRTIRNLPLSGASGTYYVYITKTTGGRIVVDGDSTTAPPVTPNGVTSLDTGSEATLFTDLTADYLVDNVSAGDVLTILNTDDAGEYLIQEVAPGSINQQLKIVGLFPTGGLAGINYTIRDMLGVELGFSSTEVVTPGRLYIGEADFDGVAVTAVRSRHFKDTFVGEWRAIDVSTGGGLFEEIYNHKLGTNLIDISVQVSSANDGTSAIEEMSLSGLSSNIDLTITDTKGVSITNTTTLNFNPGTTNATATLTGAVTAALTGTVAGSLSGGVFSERSVVAKWDRNKLWVKNPTVGKFYRDYTGALKQTGFIRVVVRKRG